jgi:hypothetical protein
MKWSVALWAILLFLAAELAAQDKEVIAIKPPEAMVQPQAKVAFMVALVKDGKVESVLPWDFTFSASRGTFSGNVYTAPEQPGTYLVFVRYQKLVGLAVVNVKAAEEPARLTISPDNVAVQPGDKFSFEAKVYAKDDKILNFRPAWGAKGGKIDQEGNFVAGQEIGKFEIMAIAGKLQAKGTVEVRKAAAVLAKLAITPASVKVQAGGSQPLQLDSYDQYGKPMAAEVKWQVAGGSLRDGMFVAGRETGKFTISASVGDIEARAEIEVVQAASVLSRLALKAERNKLLIGEKLPLLLEGYDQYDKPMPVEAKWQATGGVVTPPGTFIAGQEPGKFAILASYGELQAGLEVEIAMPPSRLSRLDIVPATAQLQKGEKNNFRAQAYDQYGKPMVVEVSWQASGGNITQEGVFIAGQEAGKFSLSAAVPDSDIKASAEVTIAATSGYRLKVAPAQILAFPGQKIKYEVAVYRDEKEVWTWPWEFTFVTSAGTFDDMVYTAPVKPGVYQITVRHPQASAVVSVEVQARENSTNDKPKPDSTDDVTPKPSEVTSTKTPEIKEVVPVKDTARSIAVDKKPFELLCGASLRLKATALDAKGNSLTRKLTWQVEGGKLSEDGTFTAGDKPGTYTLKVSDSEAGISEEITIVIRAQAKANDAVIQILVEPLRVQLTPMQKMRFKVTVLKNGSPLWLWPWEMECTTTGGIFRDFTYVAPEQEGEYQITFRYNAVSTNAYVAVKKAENEITELHIVPPKITLQTGQQQLFQAYGYDRNGKVIPSVDVQWAALGGEISASGIYRAGNRPGSYQVTAATGNLRQKAEVEIRSPVVRLVVVPTVVTMKPYEQKSFKAIAYLQNGDMKDVAVKWSASGGEVSGSGNFVAGTIAGQNYAVEAYHELSGIKAQARVTIEAEQPIVTLQVSPQSLTLSPGQQQQFLLQGFDIYGRSLPVTARWFATGGNITEKGFYQAGTVPGNYEITAIETRTGLASRAKVKIVPSPVAKNSLYQLGDKWGKFLRQGEISLEEMREYFEQELFLKPPQQIQEFQQGFTNAYGKGGRTLVLQVWQRAIQNLGTLYGERFRQGEIVENDLVLFLQKYVVRLSYFEQEMFRRGFLQGYKEQQATLIYERLWSKANE